MGANKPDPQIPDPQVRVLVFQHIPVEWTAQLIADLTGVAPSTGWVSGVLAEAADLVGDCLKLIRALLVLVTSCTRMRPAPGSAPGGGGRRWPVPIASPCSA